MTREEAIERLIDLGSIIISKNEEDKRYCHAIKLAIKALELPSAQPEIIRCKDCANYDTDWTPETAPDRHYCLVMDGMMPKDGFCNYAERRTDA